MRTPCSAAAGPTAATSVKVSSPIWTPLQIRRTPSNTANSRPSTRCRYRDGANRGHCDNTVVNTASSPNTADQAHQGSSRAGPRVPVANRSTATSGPGRASRLAAHTRASTMTEPQISAITRSAPTRINALRAACIPRHTRTPIQAAGANSSPAAGQVPTSFGCTSRIMLAPTATARTAPPTRASHRRPRRSARRRSPSHNQNPSASVTAAGSSHTAAAPIPDQARSGPVTTSRSVATTTSTAPRARRARTERAGAGALVRSRDAGVTLWTAQVAVGVLDRQDLDVVDLLEKARRAGLLTATGPIYRYSAPWVRAGLVGRHRQDEEREAREIAAHQGVRAWLIRVLTPPTVTVLGWDVGYGIWGVAGYVSIRMTQPSARVSAIVVSAAVLGCAGVLLAWLRFGGESRLARVAGWSAAVVAPLVVVPLFALALITTLLTLTTTLGPVKRLIDRARVLLSRRSAATRRYLAQWATSIRAGLVGLVVSAILGVGISVARSSDVLTVVSVIVVVGPLAGLLAGQGVIWCLRHVVVWCVHSLTRPAANSTTAATSRPECVVSSSTGTTSRTGPIRAARKHAALERRSAR